MKPLDKRSHDMMTVAGFYLTTQSYTAEKDQSLQVMRAVEVRSHERSKKLKQRMFPLRNQMGELREAMTMQVNKRINE